MNPLVKKLGLTGYLEAMEVHELSKTLSMSNSQAAKALRLPITTYRSKIKKYALKKC